MSKYCYKYPRASVTADSLVFTYVENEKKLKLLLIQRKNDPFAGKWALPGGFMDMDETVEQCAKRELQEETSLVLDSLKLFTVASKIGRDPRGRCVTSVFWTIIPYTNKINAQDDAANIAWFDVSDLPELAFDHSEIVKKALSELFKMTKKEYCKDSLFYSSEIKANIQKVLSEIL